MLQREIAQRLVDLEIFRGLSRAHVERIAREADRIMFKPGQTIIRAGEPGDAAYLVLSGTAAAQSSFAAAQDEVVTPGTLVGELAMLVEHEHSVTIVCREPVRAVRIGREMLQATMIEAPDMAEHFVARLSSRLTRMATELRRIDQMLALSGKGEPVGAGP